MPYLDNIELPDNTSIEVNSYKTGAIPFGNVDSTSTSTVFTATVPGIKRLENGTCVMLHNGVVTSAANFTINVNELGAKPSYNNMTNATRDTTIFNVNYTMLFVYDESLDSGEGGWWCYRGYNSDNNTIGYQVRTNSHSLPMTSVTYRYRLLFTSADGEHFVPANNSTSTNATSSRTVCQDKIDPFGEIVYYGTTASVAAGSRPSATALWNQYTIALGYSFNRTGAALTMTAWKPVYVKCAPQTDGSAIIDSTTPYVQDLPSTDDGKIYILLGVAYSATNIELLNNHPVYYYKDGAVRLWTNAESAPQQPSMTPVTWSELRALRDGGELVPGMQYRITDYVTTTAQEDTQSAGHPFDVIVTADSEDALNENARAAKTMRGSSVIYGGTTYPYMWSKYVTFANGDRQLIDSFYTNVSYQLWCYNNQESFEYLVAFNGVDSGEYTESGGEIITLEYDFTNTIDDPVTLTDYFDLANLSAWELKYCLDNDATRFAWAKCYLIVDDSDGFIFSCVGTTNINGSHYFLWHNIAFASEHNNAYLGSLVQYPTQGDTLDIISYDKTSVLEYEYVGVDTVADFEGTGVIYHMRDEWNNECPYDFKNIQFKRNINLSRGYPTYDSDYGTESWVYTFAATSYNIENDEWSGLKDGSLESPNGHESDEGGTTFHDNIIGRYISIFDDGDEDYLKCGRLQLNNNVFLGSWEEVGSSRDSCPYYYARCCFNNILGNNCYNNSFGRVFSHNVLGEYCYSNVFGDNCYSNSFGDYCDFNTFDGNCYYNTFGFYCHSITFGNGCYSNTFVGRCYNNTFGGSCNNNIFGNGCHHNTFGSDCRYITFGNNCSYIRTGNPWTLRGYYRNIMVDNSNSYIYLYCSQTTSQSNNYQNVHIGLGVNNTSTWKTITDSNVNQTYQTEYLPTNSQTISV